jgi:hypothetical protein
MNVTNVLIYIRGSGTNRYLVALNLGEENDGINIAEAAKNATLTFSTKPRQGSLDLSNIQLKIGEGIIVHLVE